MKRTFIVLGLALAFAACNGTNQTAALIPQQLQPQLLLQQQVHQPLPLMIL